MKSTVTLLCAIPQRNWFLFSVRLPRCLLAEWNTHRQLSRNAGSSRAVPVSKMLSRTWKEGIWMPEFQHNQKGMSPAESLTGFRLFLVKSVWYLGAKSATWTSKALALLNVHKQWANRPTEWFSYTEIICSATEWENFLHLRCDATTQKEFREVALTIKDMMKNSTEVCKSLNLEPANSLRGLPPTLFNCVSAVAGYARGTYFNSQMESTLEKDLNTFNKLASDPLHASPMEHVVFVVGENEQHGNVKGVIQFRQFMEHAYQLGWFGAIDPHLEQLSELFETWKKKHNITHEGKKS